MKLLLDQNLSYRLVEPLQDTYPDTTQVRLVGLEHADDRADALYEALGRDDVYYVELY